MLENLTTEARHERTNNLDEITVDEFLTIMNEEDQKVALAVKEALPEISAVVRASIVAYKKGGRIIYAGAGTSGRLGLLDAVECPPTFGVAPTEVVGLIAGGESAFVKAVEGAEDSKELGVSDLKSIDLNGNDIVIGIAASGRTPYVIGALEYANSIGAETASIACNKGSEIGKVANLKIEVENGPEVLTGSTRLKAGTSQKLICNMISTGTMIGVGKVYNNLLVDLMPTNEKLVDRAQRIIAEATGCTTMIAAEQLVKAKNNSKIAIVMILMNCTYEEAVQRLNESEGFVKRAVTK